MLASILVVDDDPQIRLMLSRMLEHNGYSVGAAGSAAEARAQLAERRWDLVLCDVNLPGESGLALARELSAGDSATPTVMVSGVHDLAVAQTALEAGAYAYVLKPFGESELLITVSGALVRSRRELKTRIHGDALADDVRRFRRELHDSRAETLDRLWRTVVCRSEETGEHLARMSIYAELIAERLGLEPVRCERIRQASAMHDVGKIAIPDEILYKPGPLTAEEHEAMRRHPDVGYAILGGSGSALLELAATIAVTHHERWDGSGYPRGLAGADIPLEGRIAAVADVFDALTSERVYRHAYSFDEAVQEMQRSRGRQFDPGVLDCFLGAPEAVRAVLEPAREAQAA